MGLAPVWVGAALSFSGVSSEAFADGARAPGGGESRPSGGEAPDARAYFNAGARAYAAGKYSAAIRAFEEAYRIEPRPGLVFSIGQAYRRQYFIDKSRDNLVAAIRQYRKYLQIDPDGPRRGDSAEALSQLEPFAPQISPEATGTAPKPVTQLMISSPVDEVAIALDGRAAGTLPYIAAVTPGTHHVALSAPGYRDYERDVRVMDGSVVPLDVSLDEKPARLTVVAPGGARISVDGRFREVAPAPPLQVGSGRHVVTVTLNGREPYSREIDVERDEKRTLVAKLPATAQRTTAWTFIGVGGASVLTGGGLMVAAVLREGHAKGRAVTTEADVLAYDDDLSARNRLRTAGVVTAGAALVVTALGAVLFAFDEPRPSVATPSERPSWRRTSRKPRDSSPGLDVSAAPWVSPVSAGAAIRGAF